MLDPLVPSPEQDEAISYMVRELFTEGGALNASDLGTGKTLTAIETALRLNAQTVLISAPLHTRYSWADTAMRQSNYAIPFRWINNTTKTGKLALESLKRGEAGFYFIGRELFRLIEWKGVRIDMVVHDECQTIANRKNRGYKVAFDLRHRTKYTVCQSATWYGSNFENAWGIGRVLYPDVVEKNYYSWVLKFCKTTFDPFTQSRSKVTGEREPGRFAESLPCYVNLRSSMSQPPMIEQIFVDLSRSQRKLYDEFEKKGVVWLQDHPMVADVPVVQRIRLRQLTLAECSIVQDRDGNDEVNFLPNAKSTKFEAFKEMLTELDGEKIVVATDSAKFARMVAARLGSDAFAWTGDKTGKEREAAKGKFVNGSLRYLVCTQAAISEGTDGLQHASHIMVVLSESDNPVLNQQMVGRLHRRGQEKRVLVYLMSARETIDDVQAPTLLKKELEMRQSMLKERQIA